MSDIELEISGMTCASCANRIERKLNKLDGVVATVNYATEKAKVSFPDTFSPEDLVSTVEQAGYGASVPSAGPDTGTADDDDDPTRSLRQRLLIVIALTIPVIAMGMFPIFQFTNWQWLSLIHDLDRMAGQAPVLTGRQVAPRRANVDADVRVAPMDVDDRAFDHDRIRAERPELSLGIVVGMSRGRVEREHRGHQGHRRDASARLELAHSSLLSQTRQRALQRIAARLPSGTSAVTCQNPVKSSTAVRHVAESSGP
jgi:copper chaperone CopZ